MFTYRKSELEFLGNWLENPSEMAVFVFSSREDGFSFDGVYAVARNGWWDGEPVSPILLGQDEEEAKQWMYNNRDNKNLAIRFGNKRI